MQIYSIFLYLYKYIQKNSVYLIYLTISLRDYGWEEMDYLPGIERNIDAIERDSGLRIFF